MTDPVPETGALAPPPSPRPAPSRWLSRRAVVAHVALLIWVPGCAVAAWWQVGIALGGDGLGWVYSVMWPCFAVFGTIFWWFLIHDDPETLGARGVRRAPSAIGGPGQSAPNGSSPSPEPSDQRLARAEEDDPELAAYNAYLESLSSQEKTWRRR